MIIGHYSAAFAAKAVARPVPLWLYFIAAQWLDICWSVLVLLGIEKVRIVPGFTAGHPLDHYYMPYSHGFLSAIVLSGALGAFTALFFAPSRRVTFTAVSAVSLSHWILDFLVHVSDLPLYRDAAKVGLGLWRYPAASFSLELGLLVAGAWLYARALPANDPHGRNALWAFVALLGALHAYTTFGPPPESEISMMITGIGFYLGLAALAAWLEKIRGSKCVRETMD
jgi:hypothetical protein